MPEINQQQMIGASRAPQNGAVTSKKSNNINMDDFLKILAASMSNPPLGGEGSGGGSSNGTDYISQMVQFTTLEQLQTLSENLEYTMMMTQQQQAINMIGKDVKLANGDSTVNGTIDKVKFVGGFATIEVNGKDYLMSDILEIIAK